MENSANAKETKTNKERIKEITHDLFMQKQREVWLENDNFARKGKRTYG